MSDILYIDYDTKMDDVAIVYKGEIYKASFKLDEILDILNKLGIEKSNKLVCNEETIYEGLMHINYKNIILR